MVSAGGYRCMSLNWVGGGGVLWNIQTHSTQISKLFMEGGALQTTETQSAQICQLSNPQGGEGYPGQLKLKVPKSASSLLGEGCGCGYSGPTQKYQHLWQLWFRGGGGRLSTLDSTFQEGALWNFEHKICVSRCIADSLSHTTCGSRLTECWVSSAVVKG